jgi:hypothetical protein
VRSAPDRRPASWKMELLGAGQKIIGEMLFVSSSSSSMLANGAHDSARLIMTSSRPDESSNKTAGRLGGRRPPAVSGGRSH